MLILKSGLFINHFQPIPGFYMSAVQYKSFKNTVGKEEIAYHEQFLIFAVFLTRLENFLPFSSNLRMLSANFFRNEESKICRLGKD